MSLYPIDSLFAAPVVTLLPCLVDVSKFRTPGDA
jgi:hypothetical protein